jgi:transposase-like protein
MAKKAWKPAAAAPSKRRVYTDKFRRQAVQMMLDGHTAASVAEDWGSRAPICFTAGSETNSNAPARLPRPWKRVYASWKPSCTASSGNATF